VIGRGPPTGGRCRDRRARRSGAAGGCARRAGIEHARGPASRPRSVERDRLADRAPLHEVAARLRLAERPVAPASFRQASLSRLLAQITATVAQVGRHRGGARLSRGAG
jgi:hypothetical protein